MLTAMFEKIVDECPYKSPTDMGVNMAGNCIVDDEACREASRQEIVRRYYTALCGQRQGTVQEDEVYKLDLLMKKDRCFLLPTGRLWSLHWKKPKKPVPRPQLWNCRTDGS